MATRRAVLKVKLAAQAIADPDSPLGSAFTAQLMRGFFARWHDSFMAKTDGGADETGLRWKPLSDGYRARKASEMRRGKLSARTAQQFARLRELVDRLTSQLIFRGMKPRNARSLAASLAWKTLASDPVLIGIRTHRLEESLQPGAVSGGYYATPTAFQVAERRGDELLLGTAVVDEKARPYAHHFHAARPIYQLSGATHWATGAAGDALREILSEIKEDVER